MYRRLAHAVGAALISGALMVGIASPVSAQLVVYDAATTARNTITAAVKQYLFETERQQHMKLREMARRLSALTDLRKYAIEDVPRWRTHGGDFFYAQPYNDALIFGDSSGFSIYRTEPASSRGRKAARSTRPRGTTPCSGPAGDREPDRCSRHRSNPRQRPAPPDWTKRGTPSNRRTRTRRDRSVKHPEHGRGPRQDQWRRLNRRSSAPGSHPVARRHGRTTPGRQQASSGHGHGRTGNADRHVARWPSRGRSIRGRVWRRAQNLAPAVKGESRRVSWNSICSRQFSRQSRACC